VKWSICIRAWKLLVLFFSVWGLLSSNTIYIETKHTNNFNGTRPSFISAIYLNDLFNHWSVLLAGRDNMLKLLTGASGIVLGHMAIKKGHYFLTNADQKLSCRFFIQGDVVATALGTICSDLMRINRNCRFFLAETWSQ